MTDLFTLLEAKTKEVERLTASEQALNKESALASKCLATSAFIPDCPL